MTFAYFRQYFIYIVPVSFIGEANRSTRWKQPTYPKPLTNVNGIRTHNSSGNMHYRTITTTTVLFNNSSPPLH